MFENIFLWLSTLPAVPSLAEPLLMSQSPDREQAQETLAPIIYTTLDASQLPQAHSLLQCTFWDGIDSKTPAHLVPPSTLTHAVSDSLDYWPEQSTVLAMYKKLVVGIALIASPRETYITYLAVKPGWDKAQIARYFLPETNGKI